MAAGIGMDWARPAALRGRVRNPFDR